MRSSRAPRARLPSRFPGRESPISEGWLRVRPSASARAASHPAERAGALDTDSARIAALRRDTICVPEHHTHPAHRGADTRMDLQPMIERYHAALDAFARGNPDPVKA